MQYEEEYFLHLTACGIHGQCPCAPASDVDWQRVIGLAGEHTVTLLVAAALRANPNIVVPPEIGDKPQRMLAASAKRNAIRSAAILALLQKMERDVPDYAVLKGMVFGRLYAGPEYRESIDTDLLVRSRDEKKALQFFQSEGFSVIPRTRNEHHFRCYRRDVGTFEVHVSLWQESYDKVLFDSAMNPDSLWENTQVLETDIGSFRTLGDLDGLLFSTMHFLKHFVFTGVSLRKIADIALLYQSVQNPVELDTYWSFLRKIDFAKTMHTVYRIAQRYLTIDTGENLSEDDGSMEAMLGDLFDGGYNGRLQRAERLAEWETLLREKTRRKYGKVPAFFLRLFYALQDTFYLIFPSLEQLSKSYPKLRTRRILYLPYVLHRLLTRGVRRLHDDSTAPVSESTARRELMKQLEIL